MSNILKDLPATEAIKILMENTNEIRRLFLQKIPTWTKDPKEYDKTSWGFEQGNHNDWYKGQEITLHFGAWCGTYGDSSTYKQISLDGEIFRKHFLNYLNRNKEQIMMALADSIESEAKQLKTEAASELQKEMDKLTALENS